MKSQIWDSRRRCSKMMNLSSATPETNLLLPRIVAAAVTAAASQKPSESIDPAILLKMIQPDFDKTNQVNFWELLGIQLKLNEMLTTTKSTKTPKNESLKVITTSSNEQKAQFSIENLLKDEEAEAASSPSSSSASSIYNPNTYTLQTLQTLDRRSINKKSSNQRCVCDKCGKSYATTSNLSRHKQTHRSLDSEYAKQCPHCDRVYVSMPALSMHILTHNANHECHVCGKRFSRLWLLQGHLRSHSGVRPFSCAHCSKSFADRSNLRAHILTHTGDKRFGCDKCGRRFALRAYLNRHVESCCK